MITFGPNLDGWYDVADQLSADLQRRAHEYFNRRAQEKAAIKSVAQFEAYRDSVRENFLRSIGGLPSQRTPLNARVTGRVARDGYDIEKIIYESCPNFFVTAACYVPHDLREKAPSVVFLHGHADDGKSYPRYQQVCVDLATNGFVTLAIDPIGQGERFQYIANGERVVTPCTVEHTYAGLPFVLQGASVARQFIWDVMRGIDYLESRDDVDISRLGVTGNSGGGTQTCYLMMCEPRIRAAVPCTFVMTLEAMMKTGLPQDMEQIVYNCIPAGPDHDDFLTAMAPRPILVGAAAYDMFPIEGSLEAVRRAKEVYALYGQADNVGIVVDSTHHQYSDGLREACVNWFRQHLRCEAAEFKTSHPATQEAKQLWATESGQVLTDNSAATTISDLSQELLSVNQSSAPDNIEELRNRLDQTLGVSQAGDRVAPIHARTLYEQPLEIKGLPGATSEKIWFFSAPDIMVSGVLLHPPQSTGKVLPATLLLLEDGSNDAPSEQNRIASLLRRNQRVLIFDVRGTGGVQARSKCSAYDGPPFNGFLGTYYKFSCDAIMLGMSLLGLRVFDALRGYDYLKARDDVSDVSLYGLKSAATTAFFAGALEPTVASVVVEEMLCSYRDLCRTKYFDYSRFDLKIMPWGLLRVGDIVDILPCFAGRDLTFVNPQNARGDTFTPKEWEALFISEAREPGCVSTDWMPKLQLI